MNGNHGTGCQGFGGNEIRHKRIANPGLCQGQGEYIMRTTDKLRPGPDAGAAGFGTEIQPILTKCSWWNVGGDQPYRFAANGHSMALSTHSNQLFVKQSDSIEPLGNRLGGDDGVGNNLGLFRVMRVEAQFDVDVRMPREECGQPWRQSVRAKA